MKNTVVPIQGTNIVHPKIDPADEVGPKILNHKRLEDQLGREDQLW